MYGDGFKFDPYCYDNKAIVLRIDGSILHQRLNKDRHAKLPNGKSLFEGGADSVWGEAGFDKSNLLYARYPYTPKWRASSRVRPFKNLKLHHFLLGGLVLYVLFSTVRFFVLRKKYARSNNPELKN